MQEISATSKCKIQLQKARAWLLSGGAVRRKNGYASLFDKAGLVAAKEICGTFCTAATVAMGIVTDE